MKTVQPNTLSNVNDQEKGHLYSETPISTVEAIGENTDVTVKYRATVLEDCKSRLMLQMHLNGYCSVEVRPMIGGEVGRHNATVAIGVTNIVFNEQSHILVANSPSE